MKITYKISLGPGGNNDLALFHQQEVSTALPSTVDLLNKRGQILQSMLSLIFQLKQLQKQNCGNVMTEIKAKFKVM